MTNHTPRIVLLLFSALCLSLVTTIAFAQILPGTTAFPDNDETSGRFMSLTRGFATLGESGTSMLIDVPVIAGQEPYFVIGIFDGDMRNVGFDAGTSSWYFKPAAAPKTAQGYWDPIISSRPAHLVDQAVYNVYASPDGVITGSPVSTMYSYDMADNDWTVYTIPLSAGALSTDGTKYTFTLIVDWLTSNVTQIQNNFKIQVTGNLRLFPGGNYSFIGYNNTDPMPYLFPASSIYTGLWRFILKLDAPVTELEVWDGDLDFALDTDDPLTDNVIPSFATAPTTLPDGVHYGAPADNAALGNPLRVGDPVSVRLTSPDGDWTATKTDVSGDREWERFLVSTTGPAHAIVPEIPAGLYAYEIVDLDARNTIFFHADVPVVAEQGQIGDLVWLDENENGLQDIDEPGIPGVTVELWNADGYLVDTQVTDANGNYLFDNLPFSSYYVVFNLPEGYTWTTTDAGDDALDSDANPATSTSASAQASGFATLLTGSTSDLTHDAGLLKLETDIHIAKAGNKLGANTRTIGFWKNNISKHLSNSGGTQVTKTQLVNWLWGVYGFYLPGILGNADTYFNSPSIGNATQLLTNAKKILSYTGSDIVKKTKRQLLAAELNGLSNMFTLGDSDLHLSYLKYAEDMLTAYPSNYTLLNSIHTMLDKINNATNDTSGPTIKTGSFMIFTITVTATDVPEATTYQVTDNLDKSLQFVSATNDGVYNASSHKVTWNLTLPEGDSVTTLKIAVRISGNAKCNNYPEANVAGTIYSNWVEFALGTNQVFEVTATSGSSENGICFDTTSCTTTCKFHNRAAIVKLVD